MFMDKSDKSIDFLQVRVLENKERCINMFVPQGRLAGIFAFVRDHICRISEGFDIDQIRHIDDSNRKRT